MITSRLGYRIAQSYSSNYEEPFYVNPKAHSETYNLTANSSQNYFYQWENFANYNEVFAQKHAFGAMAGMSYTYSDNRGVNAGLSGVDILKSYEENFRYLSYDNGNGKKQSGKPHKAVIRMVDDGWAAKGSGFKAGKHELYPFPFDIIELNPYNAETGEGIIQNPGW